MQRWGQGLPLGSGDGDWGPRTGRENTVAPGYRGHPRRSDLVRAERGNPGEVRALPGKPTARKAQLPRRERMANKRMPAGRKEIGKTSARESSNKQEERRNSRKR